MTMADGDLVRQHELLRAGSALALALLTECACACDTVRLVVRFALAGGLDGTGPDQIAISKALLPQPGRFWANHIERRDVRLAASSRITDLLDPDVFAVALMGIQADAVLQALENGKLIAVCEVGPAWNRALGYRLTSAGRQRARVEVHRLYRLNLSRSRLVAV